MLMISDLTTSQVSAIRTADGCFVSDADGQMARWVEYFEQLFTVDPPSGQLLTAGLQTLDADPHIVTKLHPPLAMAKRPCQS